MRLPSSKERDRWPLKSEISMFKERWFNSTNAKDIGTLYLILSLLSGLLGTAFSILIRFELSGPGVQFISNNQLYNSVVTAHAILMSAPLSLDEWLVLIESTKGSSCVKGYQDGRGETLTSKLIERGVNGINILGHIPHLIHATSRITNLKIRKILCSAEWIDRADALFPLILSSVSKLLSTTDKEASARDLA